MKYSICITIIGNATKTFLLGLRGSTRVLPRNDPSTSYEWSPVIIPSNKAYHIHTICML